MYSVLILAIIGPSVHQTYFDFPLIQRKASRYIFTIADYSLLVSVSEDSQHNETSREHSISISDLKALLH